ncbi:C-type lectin domain family 4 member F-like isoform X2 [Ornithorhynchus anatinus]|uniref:C-type lectin domain family 4 member F-like isoform X2 n=1 Tax=Ornithorhynchus anatinus TaxID=9258 RepID=UPI0010A874BD|nr:C-type lectin domain family 4 member F-like isoform X2 [Ornithorhynchus anatinus]
MRRESLRINMEDIYENILVRKMPPKPQGPFLTEEMPASLKTQHIIRAALIMLAVALASSLIAVTILYVQSRKGLRDFESSRRAKDISGLQAEVKRLQSRWKTSNDSFTVLRERYNTILKLLSEGWHSYNQNFYFFSNDSKTWAEAEGICESWDSHLTSVTSEGEQKFLVRLMNGQSHWIGLNDQENEGIWRWTDGMEFRENENKQFWDKGQPDNWDQGEGLNENCVFFQKITVQGWNDGNCDLKFHWVCKKTIPLGWEV